MILMAHVTRLAKSDKIGTIVGGFCGFKKPERMDVVDGKTLPNMDAAFGAVSGLILHNNRSGDKPTSAAIGARPTDPIGCCRTFWLCRSAASNGAKPRHPVLSGEPRFLTERSPAMGASQIKSCLPAMVCLSSDIFGSESIGRSHTSPKLVADQVNLRGSIQKRFGLPTRTAGRTAKTRLCRPVRLYGKRSLTNFASLFDHATSLSGRRYIGKRTTLIACRRVDEATRQADLFITPPKPAPKQEQLL